jgi:hypothetical protein
MLPPILVWLQGSSLVRDILGARPRVYRMGEAPQNQTKPYATFLITGLPENSLSETPSIDRCSVQLDLYHVDDAATEALAIAVRDRMELAAHMTQWRVVGRDNATRLFRISLDFDWWLSRLT